MHEIPSVLAATQVLTEIAARGDSATSAGLARRLAIPQSSCYRILKTFERAGWVVKRDRGYGLGEGLRPVAAALAERERLVDRARPALERLARETGLTAALWVREGDDAVVAACCLPLRLAAVSLKIAGRVPMLASAVGACLAAGDTRGRGRARRSNPHEERVATVRKKGWILDAGETHEHLAGICAPLAGGADAPAAISLTGLPRELSVRAAVRFRRALLRVSRRLAVPPRAALTSARRSSPAASG